MSYELAASLMILIAGAFLLFALCIAAFMSTREKRTVTQIGLDGRSQPILRYTDELHLPDHARSIVK